MALITASLLLIVVVTDPPRLALAQTRILGFLTYAMLLAKILRFCDGEKVSRQWQLIGLTAATYRESAWKQQELRWTPLGGWQNG